MDTTEYELKKIIDELKSDLIQLIISSGHDKSGKLKHSIGISLIKSSDDYKIQITALEYIKYLDKGKLLEKFYESSKVKISNAISTAIEKDINEFIRS